MNALVEQAVLVGLARRLNEQGSWTGETHLQKAAYLMHELRGTDFSFGFILYKHGPFSFELRDELTDMRSDGLIARAVDDPRYGPRLTTTARGEQLEQSLASTLSRYSGDLDWIAQTLNRRGVVELERLATAMWMTRLHERATADQRANEVIEVKPHISYDEALAAVEEIDQLLGAQPVSADV
jgi:uncharacterized protein YwgA